MISCANCNITNTADSTYCKSCGQALNETLTMRVLFRETIANYFSFDSSLKRSLLPLLFKPGQIAKSFVNGKRTTYIHPAKLYLFTSFFFFIILGLSANWEDSQPIDIHYNESELINASENQSESFISKEKPDTDLLESTMDISKEEMNINYSSEDYFMNKLRQGLEKRKNQEPFYLVKQVLDKLPYALIFSLPIFALLLMLFLYKQPIKYSGNLVFSMYYFSFTFIVWSLFFLLRSIIPVAIESYILIGIVFILLFYLIKAMRTFYVFSWKKASLIALSQSIIFMGVTIPIIVVALVFLSIVYQ